ncbi:MAG: hypothetical protein EPN82_06025 [Bacteroidetes bacterium]|nr:MAG: hypothetical protein EPN82_06025 [Bacteroidota bacterium]
MKWIYTFSIILVISISSLFSQNIIWEKINTSGSGFNNLQVNPYTNELFAAGDNGFCKTPTGIINWQNIYGTGLPTPTKGFRCFSIDSIGGIYVSLDGSTTYFFKSADNGISYDNIMRSPICNGPGSLGINSSNGYIYLGMWDPGCQYILRSTDGGSSYSQVYSRVNPYDGPDQSIEFAFKGNNNVFVVDMTGGSQAGVYRSTDAGLNWTKQSNGLPNKNVYAITMDSVGNIYIGLSTMQGNGGGVFKSIDNGNSWQDVNNNLANKDINDLAFSTNGDLFAATKGGIFIFNKGSNQWESFINNQGLIDTNVRSIIVSEDGNIFCAAGDVYKLDTISTIIENSQYKSGNSISLSIRPNPIIKSGIINYILNKPSKVYVEIRNSLCQEIEILENGINKDSGINEIIWDFDKFLPGIYYCTIKCEDNIEIIKFIVIH